MKLKVCGMRDSENIQELLKLSAGGCLLDFMGFIFYEKSPRFVGETLNPELLKSFPKDTKKVGVFVNATVDYILQNVRKYSLDYVQLHGSESPEFCRSLKRKGINIIKAFGIDESFTFSQLNNYKPFCEFFLFDTKVREHGGSGTAFNWNILKNYDNEKPFFLAGGIDLEVIDELENRLPKPYGLDVNSKFEISPGLKDINKLADLLRKMRTEEVLVA